MHSTLSIPPLGGTLHPRAHLRGFMRALALIGLLVVHNLAHASGPADETVARAARPLPRGIWLEDLDWEKHADQLERRESTKKTPLTVNGRVFPHGLGGGGRAQLMMRLDGRAERLFAAVGIDDVERSNGTKLFEVLLDDRQVSRVGPLSKGELAFLDVDLRGAQKLEIIIAHGGRESDWDRYVLGGAQIVMTSDANAKDKNLWPKPFKLVAEATLPIAPGRDPRTFINGPRMVGGTPGRPFAHRLSVSGRAPLRISVLGLPPGVRYDGASRTLRGQLPAGRFPIQVTAKGPGGQARAEIVLVGEANAAAKALSPLMGWNSWNLWGDKVSGDKIRAAADAMTASGLADYGFSYVNIDDGWEGERNKDGHLAANASFGDIAALADYVHKRGLKLGIYSSPGPKTCAGHAGSYGYEASDAKTFAAWGIDLLKYDWCTYDKIAPNYSVPEQRRPYEVMSAALNNVERDIAYSVCNYGRGDVWTWAKELGGNLWRTTSDITDTWSSLDGIAFSQDDKAKFTQPGHYGDLDMLVIGKVGWGEVRPTNLSGNEQILHVTHWVMMASPLLLGCDLLDLDQFTIDLLTNSEVLAVNQDPLVAAATRRLTQGRSEVWARPLADGSTAVALYNRGALGTNVTAPFSELGVDAEVTVRNLWLRKDVGIANEKVEAFVPQHGAVLLKLTPLRKRAAAPAGRNPRKSHRHK